MADLTNPTARDLAADYADIDRRDLAWYIDRVVQVLVFIGGISAIIFIIGIFVFVTKEGFGFLVGPFEFGEFFGSTRWKPTSEWKTTYGILALVAPIEKLGDDGSERQPVP